MSGESLYDVQKLLGHSDVSMKHRYAHLADDGLQRARDEVSQAIEEASSDQAGATPYGEEVHRVMA